jgi:hypothetical protein
VSESGLKRSVVASAFVVTDSRSVLWNMTLHIGFKPLGMRT